MTRLQIGVLTSAILLFFALYFGCETKPREIQALERSRALETESTNLEVLLRDAKESLPGSQLSEILALEEQQEEAFDDSIRADILRDLSSTWYTLGKPAIAGAYAEKVAELVGTEESWAIAGTTFTICVQRSEDEKVLNYCTDKAVKAYESAISLNPSNTAHQVNLALLYADNPPPDNPMKGITMLLDLNREQPENVLVLNSLGRLAIRTGQYDRAIDRLQQALTVEPENANTICLLARAYEGSGDQAKAQEFSTACQEMTKNIEITQ